MIIAKLNGGLGNQMFQYAAGRAISLHRATNLLLDILSLAEKDTVKDDFYHRAYKLNHFDIKADIAGTEVLELFKNDLKNLLKIKISKFLKKDLNIYYKQDSRLYSQTVFNLSNNLYLEGHWITEKFFKKYRQNLLKDFSFKTEPNSQNLDMLNKIRNSNSVSIHIRRSDYITNKNANQHFAHLSKQYYDNAIEFIKSRVKDPTFFFFSDDVDWVRQEFKDLDNSIFCDINNIENGHEDLRLMMNCNHFIIANSTFSWWGAWLSQNADKIVVAPNQWFADDIKNRNEIVPDNWIKLPI